MNLMELALVNFRNYDQLAISFSKGCVHCLYGDNAQGKTNLMEAIFFLSHLTSFRTNNSQSLIQENQSYCRIDGLVDRQNLRVILQEKQKALFAYGDPILSYSNFIGRLNAVLFCPDDLALFWQPPKVRRHFLDVELVKLSKTYTTKLAHYNGLLKQRNALLKEVKVDEILLSTFTQMMIEDILVIEDQRLRFLNRWLVLANQLFPKFSNQSHSINAQLVSHVAGKTKDELESLFAKALTRDLSLKTTTVGLHRDDIQFYFDEKPLNEQASQGQKRSFMLALKLSLCQLVQERKSESPILLLDDVFSELDEAHQQELVKSIPKDQQTFITTTHRPNPAWFAGRALRLFHIEQGRIQEELL